MEYKGYTAKVEFDDEAGLFHGRVLNLRDVITFQGTTVDELRHEFKESIEDYLEWCAERGEQPEKPCSGKFVVRIEPELHRDITVAAELSDQSLNTWVVNALQEAITTSKDKKNRKSEPADPPVTPELSGVAGDFLTIRMTHKMPRAAITSSPSSHPKGHQVSMQRVNRLNKELSLSHTETQTHPLTPADWGEHNGLN